MITGTLDDGRLNLWRSNDKLARWMLLYLLAQIAVPLTGALRGPGLTSYCCMLLALCVPASARSIDGARFRGTARCLFLFLWSSGAVGSELKQHRNDGK